MELGNTTQPDVRTKTTILRPVVADRRRPGRPENVSPHLIPILRDPSGRNDAPQRQAETGHDLVPLMGIMAGVALSVPVWAVIVGITWAIERWI